MKPRSLAFVTVSRRWLQSTLVAMLVGVAAACGACSTLANSTRQPGGGFLVGGSADETSAEAWPPPVALSPASCVSAALTGSHATYNVGPEQMYLELTAVPWLSLQAGDVVNIYYRPTPYKTKFALHAQGTAIAPVVINGVTDANCNRPEISGNGAVTAADAINSGFFTTSGGVIIESYGLITMMWGPRDPYALTPRYITIQNLKIDGANHSYSFTNHAGVKTPWLEGGASGIYAVLASHLTIENCEITGNDEGVFVNSQDTARTSYYVTLRRNVIYGNGLPRSYLDHNVYVQAFRTLYEGNYIGQVVPTSEGGSLKDRSSGTVIRYNYIESSARAIDLVDTQGAESTVGADPLYNYAWVYGNVIVDDLSTAVPSRDLIHWGGDSNGNQDGGPSYRNGTLYFYFNTVVIANGKQDGERIGIFDMPSREQTVEARSNIFWFPNTVATVEYGIWSGTITFADTNWTTKGWVPSAESGNSVVLNKSGTLLQSALPGLNRDYTPSAGPASPVIGKGVPAPATVPSGAASAANLQPIAQYANRASIVSRPNPGDLGAYAAP